MYHCWDVLIIVLTTFHFFVYSLISLTSVGLMSASTTVSGIFGVPLQMSDNDGLIQ